jgi:NAD(P)-dependent dehydrogenase (short-subunit alcohol dehydrogenase family)
MTAAPRVVLVTGASSGIGRAAAVLAAREGDHVVLVARGEAALLQTELECLAAGAASALAIPVDVRDDAGVAKAVDETRALTGTIDVVLNCAGVVAYGRTEDVPAEVFDAVLETNLIGSVNVARHVIPVLRRQRCGSLIFIGSVIGHIGVPRMSPYVLSKWGVRALARQLDLENRDLRQVRIVCVSPGGVDTPIYRQAATYSGFVGRPPPPVVSPEYVARRALRATRHGRSRIQVGVANNVMRLGYTALPWAFDAFVGPLFTVAATDRTSSVPDTTGNVLAPREVGNELHGRQGNAIVGIGRNLVAMSGRRAQSKKP